MVARPPPALRVETLARLQARIEALERRHAAGAGGREHEHPRVATGWPSVDAALGGGLPRGAVVEWIGVADPAAFDPAAFDPEAPDPPPPDDARDAGAASPDALDDGAGRRAPRRPSGSPRPVPAVGAPDARPAATSHAAAPAAGRPPLVRRWAPPLSILLHLAHRALDDDAAAPPPALGDLEASPAGAHEASDVGRRAPPTSDARPVLWIGRPVWPYPRGLVRTAAGARGRRLLERSLFVDAPDDGARLWAIDLALRCRALAAVVADAHGLPMAASRRLQLAAEAGGAFALLVRPPEELASASAAAVRWLVAREPGEARPAWRVTLRRAKGVATAASREAARPFLLEGDPVHGVLEGVLPLPADPLDRPRAAPPAAGGRARGRRDAPPRPAREPARPDDGGAGVPLGVRRVARAPGRPRSPGPEP